MSENSLRKLRREPLTDAQLLMIISIGIFAAMYLAAMATLGGGFLKAQQIFDLLNDLRRRRDRPHGHELRHLPQLLHD